MEKMKIFVKSEIVFIISAAAAIASAFFVPPSLGYIKYFDFRVLALLFCLMAVIKGISKVGVFDVVSQKLLEKVDSVKILSIILILLCFFSSMLITNDVALLAFVPLSMIVLTFAGQKKQIFVIVMQTIAANLGSALTPIGNPQNLYLYSKFNIKISDFLMITLPIVAVGFILIVFMALAASSGTINIRFHKKAMISSKKNLCTYLILFVLCLMTVLGLLNYLITLAIVLVTVLVVDRKLLKSIDYGLLLTFVCFFIFSGNIENIKGMKAFISALIIHKEMLSSIIVSQVISNVPAAIMLSSFTGNYKALLAGTNIGGLGTIVASLASLISFKIYAKSKGAMPAKFIGTFTVLNAGLLIVLTLFAVVVY
jgi:Na+/H+ antiporter NhaD/arsenite permease-like protein